MKPSKKTRPLRLSHTYYKDADVDHALAQQLRVYHYLLPKEQYKWREWQSHLDDVLGSTKITYLMRSYQGDFGLFVAIEDDTPPPQIMGNEQHLLQCQEVKFTQEVYPIWVRLIFRLSLAKDAEKAFYSLGRPLLITEHWRTDGGKKAGIHALALDCRTQQVRHHSSNNLSIDHDTQTEVALFYENIPLRNINNPETDAKEGIYWIYSGKKTLTRCPLNSWNRKLGPLFKEIPKNANRRMTRPFIDLKNSETCNNSWPALLLPIQQKFIEKARYYGFTLMPKTLNLQPLKTKTKYRTNTSKKSLFHSILNFPEINLLDHRYDQSIPFADIKVLLQSLLQKSNIKTALNIIDTAEITDTQNPCLELPTLIILDQRPNVEFDRYRDANAFKHHHATQHLNINPYDLGMIEGADQEITRDGAPFFTEVTQERTTFIKPDPSYYQYHFTATKNDISEAKMSAVLKNLQRNLEICLKELSIKALLLNQNLDIPSVLPEEATLLTENLALITEGYLFTAKNNRPVMIPLQAELENPFIQHIDEILQRFDLTYDALLPLIFEKWPYSYRPEVVMQGFGAQNERLNSFLRRITLVFHRNEMGKITIMMQDPQYDRPHILLEDIDKISQFLANQQVKKSASLWYINDHMNKEIPTLLNDMLTRKVSPISQSLYDRFQQLLPHIIQSWNQVTQDRFEKGDQPIGFNQLKQEVMKLVLEIENNQRREHKKTIIKKFSSDIYGLWHSICSPLFEINFEDVRSKFLKDIPGITKLWHDPEQGYYIVGTLAPMKLTIDRQPSIRQWHALTDDNTLDTNLLTDLVDVDWVRLNQLAGNPCPALLVRRWKELQPKGQEYNNCLFTEQD